MQMVDMWTVIFNLVAFEAGLLAIYFWLGIYDKTKKGSLAWLLLAITSTFMITAALFPSILLYWGTLNTAIRLQFLIGFMIFWSAIYVTFFSAAGFVLYNELVTIPRKDLGRFLVEGFESQGPKSIGSLCGTNCGACDLFIKNDCTGCLQENEQNQDECPIYSCVMNSEPASCWECNKQKNCLKYAENIKSCPIKRTHFHVPEIGELTNILKGSTLIRYSPLDNFEDMVIEIVLRAWGEVRNIVLISSQPRTSAYENALEDLIQIGAMKLVNISVSGDYITKSKNWINVPISDISKLYEVFIDLPEDCMIIFEPLSRIIEHIGFEKAYEIVSEMKSVLSPKFDFVCLLNSDVFEEKNDLAQIEEIFNNHSTVCEDHLEVIRGDRKDTLDMIVGEQFYIN